MQFAPWKCQILLQDWRVCSCAAFWEWKTKYCWKICSHGKLYSCKWRRGEGNIYECFEGRLVFPNFNHPLASRRHHCLQKVDCIILTCNPYWYMVVKHDRCGFGISIALLGLTLDAYVVLSVFSGGNASLTLKCAAECLIRLAPC